MIDSTYLERCFDYKKRDNIVVWCQNIIREHKLNRCYIVVTGLSGLLIGPIVSYTCKMPLIVIRKTITGSHSICEIEGKFPNSHSGRNIYYIILDDFIEDGTTVNRILDKMGKYSNMKCKAILLYNEFCKSFDHIPDSRDNISVYTTKV